MVLRMARMATDFVCRVRNLFVRRTAGAADRRRLPALRRWLPFVFFSGRSKLLPLARGRAGRTGVRVPRLHYCGLGRQAPRQPALKTGCRPAVRHNRSRKTLSLKFFTPGTNSPAKPPTLPTHLLVRNNTIHSFCA